MQVNVRILTPPAREEIRAQTVTLDEVVIEILDASTRQSVYPTQVVAREGQATRRLTLTDVPVGNLLVRLQGRANGEAAGTRSDVPVTVTADQVSTISAELTPVHNQTGLQLSPPSLALNVGGTQQVQALAVFTDLTTEPATNVSWSSANPAVANVSATGLVTGRAAGNTIVTASSGNFTATAQVTVADVPLVRLDVSPTGRTIETGGTLQFTATGTFANNSTQDLTSSVTWTSLQPSVSISSTGLATGQSPGTATVIARRGEVTGGAQLTVVDPPLSLLQVVPANATLVRNTTLQLGAQARFGGGSLQNVTGQVTWTSSNNAIATVSAQGLVSGVSRGLVNVTASLGGQTAQAVLNVTDPVLTSIAVSPANGTLVNGTTRQYTARGTFNDGSTQDITGSVTWSSTNTSVVTIDNGTGIATARGLGTSVIEATQAAISGAASVNVIAPSLVFIEVSPVTPRVFKGTAVNFTANGTFDNGVSQDLTEQVAWATSVPSVASVSNLPGSKGQALALSAGATSVTASFGGKVGSQAMFVDDNSGPTPTPSPAAQRTLYTTGTFLAQDEVVIFSPVPVPAGATPSRKILGAGVGGCQQIAIDPGRDILYVACTTGPAVNIYQPASSFNNTVAPTRSIQGPNTGLPGGGCRAVAIDTGLDQLYVGGNSDGVIRVFHGASTAMGDITPNRTIDSTLADLISYLTFDGVNNRLYSSLLTNGGTRHEVFGWNGASGLNAPGPNLPNYVANGWNSSRGLVYNAVNNRLYVADAGGPPTTIRIIDATTSPGNVQLIPPTMEGPASGFTAPQDLFVDTARNELYVLDEPVNLIRVYGNANTITGNQTELRNFGAPAPRSAAFDPLH